MTLLTLDTHIDIRWPDPPDATTETDRRVDFPKMARGGLNAAVFIAYTPQTSAMPRIWPPPPPAPRPCCATSAPAPMAPHAASAPPPPNWKTHTTPARSAC
jgi:hypothetical protein